MKISIITVVYNNRRYLEKTIKSVLEQTYDDIEYIIIDGGSDDGSLDIIRKYDEFISKWVSEPDKGVYDAMNKGISYATGDILSFLNSDDLFDSTHTVADIMSAFKDSKADICYGDLVYVSGDLKKIIRYWKPGEFSEKLISSGIMLPHPSFFARRKLYLDHGNFSREYKISSDFDLILRFITLPDITLKYIPDVLVKMRIGGVSNRTLLSIFKANMECYIILKKHGVKFPGFIIFKKLLLKLRQRLKKI